MYKIKKTLWNTLSNFNIIFQQPVSQNFQVVFNVIVTLT